METRTVSLDSLIKDGLFDIPSYQRSYSWEESQLQDLLDDMVYLPEDSTHFFGNVILDQQESQYRTDQGRRFNVFDVVDGQQRLVSALIFLHVAAEHDQVIEETVSEDNLLFPIRERPRLLPQDQDKEYFRDSLFGNSRISPETPSQSRLTQAYEYFDQQCAELPEDVAIQNLAEKLRYDFRINVVEIDDDSEAASIFESLNNRGKPLSTLDKTKSFLMYMDERSSESGALRSVINDRFGGIYNELFVLSTGHDRVQDFDEDSLQRFHWGVYDGYDSDEYFRGFETLKSRLRERYRAGEYDAVQEEINSYVRDLRQAASAFSSLFKPSERPPDIEAPLRRLLELGRLANVLPVLIAAYLEYGDDEPEKMGSVVESCETLVFRMYAIDNRRSNTGRGRIVNLAHRIHSESSFECEDVCGAIDSITDSYTSDDRLERRLRNPEFYDSNSSRDMKYLLYQYNRELEIEAAEELDADLSQILSTEYQVEHVLARNLDIEYIPAEIQKEFDDHVHRLGNLTIASRYWNSSYGNLPFSEKKHATGNREKDYHSSAIRVQRELADYNQFGKQEIDSREDKLVKFALSRWAISPSELPSPNPEPMEEFEGYVPSDFFESLTEKQEAFLRILWEEGEYIGTNEITERMEDVHGLEVNGSNTISGLLAGMTRKFEDGYRRSIMDANWTGNEYEFTLVLDSEQESRFRDAFGEQSN